jgi:hypothetical protein
MFSRALLVLSSISVVFATVYVTNPTATTVWSGGQVANVTWQDDGQSPTLHDFGLASIAIFTGNAIVQTSLQVINASVDVSAVSSVSFTVNASIGPDSSKYFIRFQSIAGKNGSNPDEAFSAQFNLTNMTGTFSPAVLSEIAGLSTAPLGGSTAASAGQTSKASSTTSTASTTPTGSSSKPSTSAKSTSGAMGIKAGWAGLVFGAVVGVTMF